MTLRIFAALALLSAATAACAGGQATTGVSEQVAVAAQGGKVVVTVTVENRGGHAIYVPKELYEATELIRREFDIRDAVTGAEVPYIGRMVKRGPLTAADFATVKPGAVKSNAIDITNTYDFKPGEHRYKLMFAGSWRSDAAALAPEATLSVMPVTFTFRK